ncbi:hypothetical protein E2C01_005087 [Portunus trituberculatus]|uniref:Uncharacterized protein n=1 Tax=Portunus trituberculatus TaxID=210409 RepID=A0A5B7CRG0_PORTR|nr:hypothetical protein [Portunus trituberculatus]
MMVQRHHDGRAGAADDREDHGAPRGSPTKATPLTSAPTLSQQCFSERLGCAAVLSDNIYKHEASHEPAAGAPRRAPRGQPVTRPGSPSSRPAGQFACFHGSMRAVVTSCLPQFHSAAGT